MRRRAISAVFPDTFKETTSPFPFLLSLNDCRLSVHPKSCSMSLFRTWFYDHQTRTGFAVAAEREINASADRVWRLMTDFQTYANVVSCDMHAERIDEGTELEGSVWKTSRKLKGGTSHAGVVRITTVDETNKRTQDAGELFRGAATTWTMSVQRITDQQGADGVSSEDSSNKCRLRGSLAIVPSGCCCTVFLALFGSCLLRRRVRQLVEGDLKDIQAAFEKDGVLNNAAKQERRIE